MIPSFAHLPRSLNVLALGLLLSFPVLAQDAAGDIAFAQVAVQRASDADADQYSPELIEQARSGLSIAQSMLLDKRQRKQAPLLAQRAAADADLARVLSEEAVANADLKQRRAEISQLQRSLGELK